MITVISDREGDIYPSWATVLADDCHMLVRAMVDRRPRRRKDKPGWRRYAVRGGLSREPASTAVAEAEVETLAALVSTLEGRTERQMNPHRQQSLACATLICALVSVLQCAFRI